MGEVKELVGIARADQSFNSEPVIAGEDCLQIYHCVATKSLYIKLQKGKSNDGDGGGVDQSTAATKFLTTEELSWKRALLWVFLMSHMVVEVSSVKALPIADVEYLSHTLPKLAKTKKDFISLMATFSTGKISPTKSSSQEEGIDGSNANYNAHATRKARFTNNQQNVANFTGPLLYFAYIVPPADPGADPAEREKLEMELDRNIRSLLDKPGSGNGQDNRAMEENYHGGKGKGGRRVGKGGNEALRESDVLFNLDPNGIAFVIETKEIVPKDTSLNEAFLSVLEDACVQDLFSTDDILPSNSSNGRGKSDEKGASSKASAEGNTSGSLHVAYLDRAQFSLQSLLPLFTVAENVDGQNHTGVPSHLCGNDSEYKSGNSHGAYKDLLSIDFLYPLGFGGEVGNNDLKLKASLFDHSCSSLAKLKICVDQVTNSMDERRKQPLPLFFGKLQLELMHALLDPVPLSSQLLVKFRDKVTPQPQPALLRVWEKEAPPFEVIWRWADAEAMELEIIDTLEKTKQTQKTENPTVALKTRHPNPARRDESQQKITILAKRELQFVTTSFKRENTDSSSFSAGVQLEVTTDSPQSQEEDS
jgi:hypothetical protein